MISSTASEVRPAGARRAVERHVVCRRDELGPGVSRSFAVGGRRVVVACLPDGVSYKAVAGTCPHEAAPLGAGKVEKMWVGDRVGELRESGERCVIVCPWHNFEFDLETGLSVCEPGRMRLKTYRAALEGDLVVVYA
jgi:3-phenylpropionate/trans-cinnamate dioxygenase ferredoxin subunit